MRIRYGLKAAFDYVVGEELINFASAATQHPEKLLAQLATTPLVAKAVIEDRPLEELPAPIVPKGIAGRLRTEASLRGTLERPVFSDKIGW